MNTSTETLRHEPFMADLAPSRSDRALLSVEHDANSVALAWDDGQESRFSASWLRDNCPCNRCRHPQAMERVYMFIDHGAPSITHAIQLSADSVEVHFLQGEERHVSRYSSHWLRRHHYSGPYNEPASPKRILWDSGLNGAVPTVAYSDFLSTDAGLRAWIEAIQVQGIVVLQGVPTVPGKLLEVARRVGPVRQTNFGDHYDVISMPNPNAVAYTALGLELHNDLVNWTNPPDVQMLCCLKNSVTGGESIFADGFRVAAALRDHNPAAFSLLAEHPVEFRFHDASCDIRTSAPMLTLDAHGNLVRMRFNNWLRSPLNVPEDRMDAMYEAIGKLWSMLRDPAFHLNLKLQPGELVAYDNSRILHGRKSFDPNTGERHLQGCYMNREDLDSALRLLDRSAAQNRQP